MVSSYDASAMHILGSVCHDIIGTDVVLLLVGLKEGIDNHSYIDDMQ